MINECVTVLHTQAQPMERSRRPSPASRNRQHGGAASLDLVLILGVVLPLVGFVLPASRIAIQAAFSWFCRVTTTPFL